VLRDEIPGRKQREELRGFSEVGALGYIMRFVTTNLPLHPKEERSV
jgi:hypothetical protein